MKNESLLSLIQFLLLANFIAGFFFNKTGSLFGGMFTYQCADRFSKKYFKPGSLSYFFIICRLVKKNRTHAGIFYTDVIGFAGNVFYDLQW